MSARNDMIDAIDFIEKAVCEKMHPDQTPRGLAKSLFGSLRDAIANDRLPVGRELTRSEAAKELKVSPKGAFKDAISTISKRLMRCRPSVRLPEKDSRPGVACIARKIGGVPHLVFVRGPLDEHRGTGRKDEFLQLTAEFRRLADSDGRVAEPVVPLVAVEGESDLCPEDIAVCLRRTSMFLSSAMAAFGTNPRAQDLIRQHAGTFARALESEAESLARGGIVNDYDNCALLTDCVAGLLDGDELLGLTDWEADREWWDSEDARRFLDANAMAIRQKATIRRTFVHNGNGTGAESLTAMIAEMEKHVEIGVQARSIERSRLSSSTPEPRSQCVLRTRDGHGASHGWLTYKVELNVHGKPLHNIFSINPQQIRANDLLLERIWQNAIAYPRRQNRTPRLRNARKR